MFYNLVLSVKLQPRVVFCGFCATMALALVLCIAVPATCAQSAPNWPPLGREDLALKDNPLSPGAPALILDYEVETDSAKSTETVYKRIKIFREEGKKYADVEIPYFESQTQVEEIKARVTSPDGKSEEFNGAIYEKEVIKAKKYRFSAKTFALPNVEVGSIIEYSYRLHWRSDIPDVFRNPGRYMITEAMAYPAAGWEIQQDLSVRRGHFLLHPIKDAKTTTFKRGLPENAIQRTLGHGTVEIEVRDIPAFQEEEYSPPEAALKARADVYYTFGLILQDPKYFWTTVGHQDSEYFWMSVARHEAEYYDAYIGKRKGIQKEVERLISPGDSEETKLKKIYTRVQQIRALTYEPEKSKKERKQENLKENKNVEDVLNRGYAANNEINLLFIAMARAAGLQAYPVRVTARNRNIFARERLDPSQLNALVVEVAGGSSPRFFDPATLYCPYGLLPWEETHAGGILVRGSSGQIGNTPMPVSKDAVTRRRAELSLDADGNLEGSVTIMYEGQEALTRRLKAIDQDEAERRKDLEESMQKSLPQGAVVNLVSTDAWTNSDAPLKAEFHVQVPGYANKAGQRLVLPLAAFHTNGVNPFVSTRRTHPINFDYPAEIYEDVTFALPAGIEIESLPNNQKIEADIAHYDLSLEKTTNSLRVKRQFKFTAYFLPVERYPALRLLYANVRTNDEQQAILKTAQLVSKN